MSSSYHSTPASVDAQHSQEYIEDQDFSRPTQSNHSLLSPNNSQLQSNSTSPSYNINSTPGESLSEYSTYQPSELSEIDDPFFGVDFDAGVNRVDSLSSALFNQAYQSIQHNPPLQTSNPPPETSSLSEPLSATSTYPLSPIPSTSPNTPSPSFGFDELKTKATISQQELRTDLHNTQYHTIDPRAVQVPTTVQLTPDHSGSSNTSTEDFRSANMNRALESPRISVSQWESMDRQSPGPEIPQTGRKRSSSNNDLIGRQSASHVVRDEEYGTWRANPTTGQAGIDPDARKVLDTTTVKTLKEQEREREIESTNLDILDWNSQADMTSGGNQPVQSYFELNSHIWETQSTGRQIDPDEDNIAPVDEDLISEHENQLQDGQTYYNFKNGAPNAVDFRLMHQSRHWSDAPGLSYIIKDSTQFQQPLTSNEAMMRWNRESDAYSIASRAATWGTRRRSEPSIADWESVADGSFLKKLSISKSKDSGRFRNNSIFDQGLTRLASFTRKRSDSRLKRARSAVNIPEESHSSMDPRKNSQDTLAPPSHSNYSTKNIPNLNTTIAGIGGSIASIATGHVRSGSVSGPTTSPKSPLHLGGLSSIIKRARSKSELTSQEKAQTGIAGMWRGTGGPPVAVPASVPTAAPAPISTPVKPEPQQPKAMDFDDDEDDDDDLGDEEDMKANPEEETDPIVPNYEGFKAHVRRLNPDMEPRYNWLVSRIAHQQEIRYKNLLELRVKHQQAVGQQNCQAGHHCVALGGNATLFDAKGHPREQERGLGLQIITDLGNESDSNPGEGALNDETFPQGVPKPPTKNLPAEFECQLCFKAKKFHKPSDWTKHVHEDVQPFTCTYDKCKEPKSFKRKADWVRHENERHRHLEWWVCQYEDCKHPCYRKDNFLQHLVREHKLPEPKQKTKAAIKKARSAEMAWVMLDRCHHETQNRPQDEPCKFCGKTFATWKNLTVHLAKHMEHISLPILKLVDARVVDANTIISPVEQILTPVTPVGRGKIESSPFNMAGISPHNPMGTGFHPTGFNQSPYYQVPVSQPFLPSQSMGFDPNMFATQYNQPIDQTRGFTNMSPNHITHIDQARNFGSMDSGFSTHVKMEQPQGYGSIDSNFSRIPDPNFGQAPHNGYHLPQNTMAQTFSGAPAPADYQATTMHGVNDGSFDFDPMAVNAGQSFAQHIPMSRAPGSGSSYGHSPQIGQNQNYQYNNHQ